MTDPPQHGNLEQLSLPRLLIELYSARFTGRLELRRDRVVKGFLFQNGAPVFAATSQSWNASPSVLTPPRL